MVASPKSICPHAGCMKLTSGGRCEQHKRDKYTTKPRGTTAERGYGARWQAMSNKHRRDNPLCEECKGNGVIEPATCVDHVTPHKGNEALLYDPSNLRALCWACHSRKTRRETSKA